MSAPPEEAQKVAELREAKRLRDGKLTAEQRRDAERRQSEQAKVQSLINGEFRRMRDECPTAWGIVQNLYRMLPLEGTAADKALQRQGVRQVADYMADAAANGERDA